MGLLSKADALAFVAAVLDDLYWDEFSGRNGWRIQCFMSDGTPSLDEVWTLPLADIVGVQAMRLTARRDGYGFAMMTRVRT
jgi:hypothetical protein